MTSRTVPFSKNDTCQILEWEAHQFWQLRRELQAYAHAHHGGKVSVLLISVRACFTLQGQEVDLQLDDMWQDLEYQPGDTLNLLDPVWLDDTQTETRGAPTVGPRRGRVCAQKGMIILHPDILLSGEAYIHIINVHVCASPSRLTCVDTLNPTRISNSPCACAASRWLLHGGDFPAASGRLILHMHC